MTVAEIIARLYAQQYESPDGFALKGDRLLAELVDLALEGEEARRRHWHGDRPAAPEVDGGL